MKKLVVSFLTIFILALGLGCKVQVGGIDTTVPNPVTDLQAISEDGKIIITWTDSADEDLLGVKIYNGEQISRSSANFDDGVLVGKGLQRYEVSNLENGKNYVFRVSSIDRALNESPAVRTNVVTFRSNGLEEGTYNIYHFQQSVNGGSGFENYTLDSKENEKDLAANSTIEEIKKSFEGFTASNMVRNGDSIYIFYDRNKVTYTFSAGDDGRFKNGTTSASVSGLYGSSFTKPKAPISVDHRFVKWQDLVDGDIPETFGAEDKTFVPVWKDKVFVDDGFVNVDYGEDCFAISPTEITYAKWYEVYQWAIENGYVFQNLGREGNSGQDGATPGATNKPVTSISWRDAVVWCNAASEKAGLTPVYEYGGDVLREAENYNAKGSNRANTTNVKAGEGKADLAVVNVAADGYRLPTEAEWEFAAKGGSDFKYSGSDSVTEVAWCSENSGNSTHEVQTLAANGYGIYDMSGNVWEWCQDLSSPDALTRTVRGGSYYGNATNSEISYRDKKDPFHALSSCGLRVVRCVE